MPSTDSKHVQKHRTDIQDVGLLPKLLCSTRQKTRYFLSQFLRFQGLGNQAEVVLFATGSYFQGGNERQKGITECHLAVQQRLYETFNISGMASECFE